MPTRDILPKHVKPVHYDLELYDINVNANTFEGRVKIELDILRDSNAIILHASGLKFNATEITYSITKTESNVNVTSIEYHEKNETATLHLQETLKAGPSAKAILTIQYSGKIKTNMSGFYRSEYKDLNGKDQVLLSTQFEATEARTALPSFDEPNLKATFQLTLTVAEDFTALSNTPVLSSKVLDDGKKKGTIETFGLKTVKFQQTPIQSTYLFAWAIGKLDYIESFTSKSYDGKKLPVRVYTQEGISEQGKFGLEVATKVVDYFSEIFDIDYVLPKLDLISVPAYSHNAMENWGLITFRPTALLFDEKTSDSQYKKKVAYVVSHELAHQWFGNLVTMDWWDELWLNEGFATWVGNLAVDHLFPEWRTFDVDKVTGVQSGFEIDSLKSSHPVEVPIQSSSDIDQVFDAVSYLKGGAVINQIARFLGVGIFLKGVSAYLKENKFSNADTNDLLESISKVSGEDIVTQVNDWIRKIGYPVVIVKQNDQGDVEFSQSRFLSSGEVSSEDDRTVWWIPLNISTGLDTEDKITVELSTKSKVSKGLGKSFFKLNKNTDGFYRVVYDSKTLSTIIENFDKLSPTDKIGLITDSAITSAAGLNPTSEFLDLLKSFKGETDYVVWSAIFEVLKLFKSSWFESSSSSNDLKEGLDKFIKDVVTPVALSLDFNVDPSESYLTTKFRSEAFSAAVSSGVPEVLKKAKDQFALGDDSIHPSLKSVVYKTVVSGEDSTEEDFEKVYGIIKTSKGLDTRETILTALGSVTNPTLISKAVSLILSEEVPIMDIQFVAYPLGANPRSRYALLNFFKENYDAIYSRLNVNPVVFDRFVKFSFKRYASEQAYDTIRTIFEGKDSYGFERSLDQVLESIKANAKWVKRDTDNVFHWLKEHNYI